MTARLLSVYIARRFFTTLVVILAAVGLVALLVDYVDVLDQHADDAGFTALIGLRLALMRVLILLDVLLPFAFLFGAVISLIDLSRKSELVVARASGVSVWGFLRGPFVVALVFGALATALFNPLAVSMKQKATNWEAQLSGEAPREEGYWFRQEGADGGKSIIHAGSSSNDGRDLFGVTAFVFDSDGRFQEKVFAPRAEFTSGHWTMTDAQVVSAASPRRKVARYELPTRLRVEELKRRFIEPEAISVWSLPGFIETAKRTGLDPDRFRVAFHALLNRPIMLLAMVMIAATVSLKLTRYGGTWRLILTGATIGFLLYAASEIVSDLGRNGIIDPVLAAWLPPIVALTFGATALLYQEDG
jgi:lipopolysaccharide export system permease protein